MDGGRWGQSSRQLGCWDRAMCDHGTKIIRRNRWAEKSHGLREGERLLGFEEAVARSVAFGVAAVSSMYVVTNFVWKKRCMRQHLTFYAGPTIVSPGHERILAIAKDT